MSGPSNPVILALDAHGGDFGPEVLTAAALDALGEDSALQIRLVGLAPELEPLLDAPPLPLENDNVSLLMIRAGDYSAAIRVAALQGHQEIVVKPVGPQISSIPGILGGTIAADGQVMNFFVAAVSDDAITVDGNHPLAGHALTFDIELVSIA